MITLEQVSRRIFNDPSWFVKSIVGTFLLIVPIAHFFAFGYLYRQMLAVRHGDVSGLPEWEDWRGLFVDGLRAFLIVLVLGVLPIFVGWVVSLPIVPFLGALGYLPMVPGFLFAAPLSAAGIYRYQRREEFAEAFDFSVLLRMVARTRSQLIVPTLAYLGLLFVLSPLFPYALFTGALLVFSFYALIFRQSEAAFRSAASGHSVIHR